MFNLIVKDLLMLKKTILFSALYLIIMIITFQNMGQGAEGQSLIAGIVILTYILLFSACAYDEKNKSDIMLNSLPLNRSTIVMSRYLSVLIYAVLGTIEYIIIFGITNLSGFPLKVSPITIEGFMSAILAVTILSGIYLPVFFKLGYIKSRIFNYIIFFTIFFSIGVISFIVKKNSDKTFLRNIIEYTDSLSDIQILFSIVVIILLIFISSYTIAVKMYKNREF